MLTEEDLRRRFLRLVEIVPDLMRLHTALTLILIRPFIAMRHIDLIIDIRLRVPAMLPDGLKNGKRRLPLDPYITDEPPALTETRKRTRVADHRYIAEADRLPPGPRRLKHAACRDHDADPLLHRLSQGIPGVFRKGNVIM